MAFTRIAYEFNALRRVVRDKKARPYVDKALRLFDKYYSKKPISVCDYSLAKDFYRNGNRIAFEDMYFEKRRRLALSQFLAFYDDAYIEETERSVASLCDEFTWVLPAHNYNGDLKRFEYDTIDLFSAETSLYLSQIYYLFSDRLSEDIKYRIEFCLKERIIKPFENRADYFTGGESSNWIAVMTAGVGAAYLCCFPRELDSVKRRLFDSMEHYLSGLGSDGYCFEGRGYFGYGYGMFAVFLDMYESITGERPPLSDLKIAEDSALFDRYSDLGYGQYLPFADGGSYNKEEAECPPAMPLFDIGARAAIKNIYGDKFRFAVNASGIFDDDGGLKARLDRPLVPQFIMALGNADEVKEQSDGFEKFYKSGGVFIHGSADYSFTAKAGDNGEMHNHNDVGAFALFLKNKVVIADLGAGEYTSRYFNNATRYGEDIFVCSSLSHSVPIIDGKAQCAGKQYSGKVISAGDGVFSVDIAGAYGTDIERLEVKFECKKSGVALSYDFADGSPHDVTLRFVSPHKPVVKDGTARIGSATLRYDGSLSPEVSKKEYSGHDGKRESVYLIDFSARGVKRGKWTFSFEVGE